VPPPKAQGGQAQRAVSAAAARILTSIGRSHAATDARPQPPHIELDDLHTGSAQCMVARPTYSAPRSSGFCAHPARYGMWEGGGGWGDRCAAGGGQMEPLTGTRLVPGVANCSGLERVLVSVRTF
jgi:hypothetical protein